MNKIIAIPNYQKRTFTLFKTMFLKYRTSKFSKQEFEEMENNTSADWQSFLDKSNFYHLIN